MISGSHSAVAMKADRFDKASEEDARGMRECFGYNTLGSQGVHRLDTLWHGC
jgi:hypothetical protein